MSILEPDSSSLKSAKDEYFRVIKNYDVYFLQSYR